MTKICKYCHKSYYGLGIKYCSSVCASAYKKLHHAEMNNPFITKPCQSCNDEFRTKYNERVLCLTCANTYFWNSDNTQLQRMVANILDNLMQKRL